MKDALREWLAELEADCSSRSPRVSLGCDRGGVRWVRYLADSVLVEERWDASIRGWVASRYIVAGQRGKAWPYVTDRAKVQAVTQFEFYRLWRDAI